MVEWHITPDYIVNNWTEELLELMLSKFADRKQRELDIIEGRSGGNSPGDNKVSDELLFKQMGKSVKVRKKNAS